MSCSEDPPTTSAQCRTTQDPLAEPSVISRAAHLLTGPNALLVIDERAGRPVIADSPLSDLIRQALALPELRIAVISNRSRQRLVASTRLLGSVDLVSVTMLPTQARLVDEAGLRALADALRIEAERKAVVIVRSTTTSDGNECSELLASDSATADITPILLPVEEVISSILTEMYRHRQEETCSQDP